MRRSRKGSGDERQKGQKRNYETWKSSSTERDRTSIGSDGVNVSTKSVVHDASQPASNISGHLAGDETGTLPVFTDFWGDFFCITTITVVYESEHEPSAPTLFCWQSLELLYQPQMVILQCKSTQVYPNKDCSRTEWQANCQTADCMWHHRVLCAFFRRTFAAMCVFLTTSVYFQLWTWYF